MDFDGGSCGGDSRERRYKSKNLEAERKRRDKLKRNLHALRALVPNITKMSKESTLSDAIGYITELEGQIKDLQRQLQEDGDRSCGADAAHGNDREQNVLPGFEGEVEVSPIGGDARFYVRVLCRNRGGSFLKLVEAVAQLGMEVGSASFVAGGNGVAEITFCLEVAGCVGGHGPGQVVAEEVRAVLLRML